MGRKRSTPRRFRCSETSSCAAVEAGPDNTSKLAKQQIPMPRPKLPRWSLTGLKTLGIQTFPVVLGVLLALALTQWNDDRIHKLQAQEATARTLDEVRLNHRPELLVGSSLGQWLRVRRYVGLVLPAATHFWHLPGPREHLFSIGNRLLDPSSAPGIVCQVDPLRY